PQEALEAIKEFLDGNQANASIGLDASTMQRDLLYSILEQILDRKADEALVQIYYTQPGEYHEGDFETPSPTVKVLRFGRSDFHRPGAIVIFPGFNVSDSCVVLAHTLLGHTEQASLPLRWVFCHPGSKYEFYERARGEHSVF